jgi:hypothetical protein
MPRPPRDDDAVKSDAEATAAIEAAGYTGVTNMAHHGRVWRADATAADGTEATVMVHGKTGRVHVGGDDDDGDDAPAAA